MNASIQHRFWIVVAASICCPFWAAAQNLIVNGGFDTDATGWTASNDSPGGGWACCKGNPGGLFWLDNTTPSLTTDPTISQVVNGQTPGVSYTVSGDYEKLIDRGGGSPTGLSFGVAIDGVFRYEAPQSGWAWHSFGFAFVATSSSVTLSISAQRNGTGVSYGVDNIIMQPTPTFALRIVESNVVLSWPTNTLGFGIQSATNLNAANWSVVTNVPTIIGSNYSVTLSATQQIQFFRLKR
jgi:hypothetical protein